MGKVLVEKLLRDCGELNKIYILVRTKKGVTPQKRYENYINDVGKWKLKLNDVQIKYKQ